MRHWARKNLDRLVCLLPLYFRRLLLKSFANHPASTLEAGFRVFPQVFYSPLVDPREIDVQALRNKRFLPGISIDESRVLGLVQELSQYSAELDQFPRDASGKHFVWSETYPSVDTAALYCLVRHLKPKRYIEVGCGYSSRVSSAALRRNEQDGVRCHASFIEPYPGPRLEDANLYGELLVQRIQDTPLSYFESLNENDILFIDTSHVVKCQNDVEYEFIHVLPSLKRGVWIHIHDISTPYDQREDWMTGPAYAWGAANEQYILESLLSGGKTFEVKLPLYWLGREFPKELFKLIPETTDRPQAFWIYKGA